MKRLIVAVVILLSVATLCITSLYMQKGDMQYLMNLTDKMEKLLGQKNWGECVEVSDQFVSEFKERTRLFPFFMRHSDVSQIEEEVVTLPVLLRTGQTDEYAVELAKCRCMLKKLSELETPIPENIL